MNRIAKDSEGERRNNKWNSLRFCVDETIIDTKAVEQDSAN